MILSYVLLIVYIGTIEFVALTAENTEKIRRLKALRSSVGDIELLFYKLNVNNYY